MVQSRETENQRPRWVFSANGPCSWYGQLWIVYAQQRPRYLALVDFQPLQRDWSEVRLRLDVPTILERAGGLAGLGKVVVSWAVLSPGLVEYETHRVLFSFREFTITQSPDVFAAIRDDEPLTYVMTCAPDFQAPQARAWAVVWREWIGCWLRRRVPGYAAFTRYYRRKKRER
jgi:hypothetical protein